MPLCSCALGELRSYLPEQLLKSVCVHVRRSPTTILCFKGAWRVARGAALGGRTTQPKTPPPGRDASLRTKLKSPFYKYVTELSLNAEVNNATNLKNRNIDWYSSPRSGKSLARCDRTRARRARARSYASVTPYAPPRRHMVGSTRRK